MTLKSIDLKQFTGSETLYRHWSRLLYTEGVQYLAKHGQAYWLIDVIASHQINPKIKHDSMLQDFQFWKLKVNADKSALLTCERDTDDVALTQQIPLTDFPLDIVKLYLIDGVLMLTSEY